MNIHGITIKNFKRIEFVELNPATFEVIGGMNGQGKSSLFDAIVTVFGGKKSTPTDPVRHGEEVATIKIDTGDYIITRTVDPDGDSRVTIKDANGAPIKSSETFLQSLFDSLTFDPSAFMRMKPAERLDALRKTTGLDTSRLDAERQAVYADRTIIGREKDSVKKRFDAAVYHADAPKTETTATAILDAIGKADRWSRECAADDRDIESANARIERAKAELAAAEKSLEIATNRRSARDLEKPERTDTEAMRKELNEVETLNRKVRDNRTHADLRAEFDRKEAEYKAKSDRIDAIDAEKRNMIAAAKFPVDGLTIDDNGVRFNGVPFENASTAEQLRVSFGLAAARNPQLRVVLIREGSMFDTDSLRLVAQMAEASNFQVIMERVGKGDECTTIIEGGRNASK